MKALHNRMARAVLLIVLGALLSSLNAAKAETDMQLQEKALIARELSRRGLMDHENHVSPAEEITKFRGVFYGYLPCQEENCDGLKLTLSLNVKNNYLLVIQPAKPQNRESFEKGKYQWDDAKGIVVLIPNKDAPQRRLEIKDTETLLYLSTDGIPMPGNQDRYRLTRSDKANNREMHIH
jgi:hypothetical protein